MVGNSKGASGKPVNRRPRPRSEQEQREYDERELEDLKKAIPNDRYRFWNEQEAASASKDSVYFAAKFHINQQRRKIEELESEVRSANFEHGRKMWEVGHVVGILQNTAVKEGAEGMIRQAINILKYISKEKD